MFAGGFFLDTRLPVVYQFEISIFLSFHRRAAEYAEFAQRGIHKGLLSAFTRRLPAGKGRFSCSLR
jgi:hypothetical protein